MFSIRIKTIAGAGLLMVYISLSAHESPQHQLIHLNDQLQSSTSENSTEKIQTLLRRADLQRRELQWDAALVDYGSVIDMEPDNVSARVGKAQLNLDQKNFKAAILWSDWVLRRQPEHAQAGLTKARALIGQGEHREAHEWFENSIAQLKKPTPEHFLEYAEVVIASGGVDADQKAIRILDSGAELLNHPVSLHSASLNIEKSRRDYQAALSRTTFMLNRQNNLLTWQLYQGELQAGLLRKIEARQTLSDLIEKLDALSPHRQNSPAMSSLRQSTIELMVQLDN